MKHDFYHLKAAKRDLILWQLIT